MLVTTSGLTRRFGDLMAVNRLDLELPSGGVVGLVGPNGSGKSTLIRMLLGLIAPSAGSAEVLGSPISDPRAYAHRVGALIEHPAFVPGLSARSNLVSLARLRGLPVSRVEEVLEAVGLQGRDREPVKRFSLGMKQRLGIAAALLPDPELLVLDEPTNGLDPAGIVEVRRLLKDLGRSGRTVVVSSHLMSEVESICSHLVVIRFGVLVYAGPIGDLLASATSHIHVVPEHPEDTGLLQDALVAAGWDLVPAPDGAVRILASPDLAARVNRDAHAAGITLASLAAHRDSLETIFLEMTGSIDGELAAARSQAVA